MAANNKRLAVVSLGCSKNLVDTEVMLGAMTGAGYELTGDYARADVILINTCAFIADALREAGETIDEMSSHRRAGTCSLLIVAGCLPERLREGFAARFPDVDVTVGTSSAGRIMEILRDGTRENLTPHEEDKFDGAPRFRVTVPWTAYLKISEGCSNRCSYCRIPSIRGPYRSRSKDSLIAEAKTLAAAGAREIVLIAQDTTMYGADTGYTPGLAGLVRELSLIEDIRWLRVMYAYPELVTDELIEVMATTPSVCHYIDMPVQHISAGVLRAMRRRGGPEAIRSAIARLRAAMPDICIRTTILTGFPGETAADFTELIEFIREVKFDRLGAFAFSPEDGTPAAGFDGLMAEADRLARKDAVMREQSAISLARNEALVGSTMEVLVDSQWRDRRGRLIVAGRTYRDAPDIDGTFILKRNARPGAFVQATVSRATEYDLEGK